MDMSGPQLHLGLIYTVTVSCTFGLSSVPAFGLLDGLSVNGALLCEKDLDLRLAMRRPWVISLGSCNG